MARAVILAGVLPRPGGCQQVVIACGGGRRLLGPAPGLLRLLVFLEQSQIVDTVFPESASRGQAGDGFGPVQQLEPAARLRLARAIDELVAGQQQVELALVLCQAVALRFIEEGPVRMILPRLSALRRAIRVLSQTSMPWLRLSARSMAVLIRQSACTAPIVVRLLFALCRRHGKPAVCCCQMLLHLDEHGPQDERQKQAPQRQPERRKPAADGGAGISEPVPGGSTPGHDARADREESAQVFGQVPCLLVPVFRRGPRHLRMMLSIVQGM